MDHITRIILTNRNNPNQTEAYTTGTSEAVESILLRDGWIGPVDGQFEKDRVVVTLEEGVLFADAHAALNHLFL